MSELRIDLNDAPSVLKETGEMLLKLAGVPPVIITTQETLVEEPAPVTQETLVEEPAPVTQETQTDDDLVDASGLPWDERIHSGGRSKKTNGTWKYRRGVDKNLIAQIEAELRSGLIPPQNQETKPVTQSQVDPSPSHVFGQQQQGASTPAPVEDPNQIQWPYLLRRIAAATQEGRLDQNKMNEMLASQGITGGTPMLVTRPDLYGWLIQELGL